MTQDQYLVLRVPKGAIAQPRPAKRSSGPVAWTKAGRNMPIGELAVETHRLDSGEATELRQDPNVGGVARILPMQLHQPKSRCPASTNGEASTWGIRAVRALDSPFSGDEIAVAVLDTGIDLGHPAFDQRPITTRNFTSGVETDVDGHGTHCAATILGQDVDGLRIGVARDARAIVAKVIDDDGRASSASVTEAILWAAREGAHVISMSLGVDFPGYVAELVEEGIDELAATSIGLEAYTATIDIYRTLSSFLQTSGEERQRVLLVAASGNSSDHRADPPLALTADPPAASAGVAAVGAVGNDDGTDGLTVASFSNINPEVVAPGVDVISAVPGDGLASFNGTSMATPHVAGVAALWAQKLREVGGHVPIGRVESSLIAYSSTAPLAGGFDPAAVGAGLVQAPQS